MSSPFPGMDPYLEGSLWMSVHSQLTAEIARQLAPKLRPKYLALTTERFVLDEAGGVYVATTSIYPDVSVIETGANSRVEGGVATAPPIRLATVVPVRVPHVIVEIRETATRRLVAAIEVLSPTNKRGEGRDEYLTKRRRILVSTAHLLEVDLLRQGQRVPMQQPLPEAPYFVLLSRAEERPITEVWPIQLRDPLPLVPVPLLQGDADVALDLQQALTNVYDFLCYDLAVDDSGPPELPLPRDEAAWAVERLRAATRPQ
jgi:hypothetical protein